MEAGLFAAVLKATISAYGARLAVLIRGARHPILPSRLPALAVDAVPERTLLIIATAEAFGKRSRHSGVRLLGADIAASTILGCLARFPNKRFLERAAIVVSSGTPVGSALPVGGAALTALLLG